MTMDERAKERVDTGSRSGKITRQKFFVAKDLQLSIALLTVIAMLGALLLHSLSSTLMNTYHLKTPAIGIILILGFMGIVIVISFFFTHRFVGPFKRLEREMGITTRNSRFADLSVRGNDDLYIRGFIRTLNGFISRAKSNSDEFDELSLDTAGRLSNISERLDALPSIQKELDALKEDLLERRTSILSVEKKK